MKCQTCEKLGQCAAAKSLTFSIEYLIKNWFVIEPLKALKPTKDVSDVCAAQSTGGECNHLKVEAA